MRTLLIMTGVAMLAFAALAAYLLFEAKDDPDVIARAAFEAEFARLADAAKDNDGPAKIALGDLLRDTPVEHGGDPARAAAFYRTAAKNGHTAAQERLGAMYENGTGVPRDLARAFELYRVAARVGNNADAQYALARMYFEGRGVLHDYGLAVDWYLRAAEGGHPVAQFLAGRMYRDGWGVEADAVTALQWFILAAERRADVVAVDPKFTVVRERDELSASLNAHQVREAERRAQKRRALGR